MIGGMILAVLGGLVVAYTFAGYPAVLRVAARRGLRWTPPAQAPDPLPRISITVPVYNEVHQIEALLESLVALEYPTHRRQILIVSDGSDDGTDEVVAAWADRGVELLRVEVRGGKGAAENAAREHLTGDIIVNTDASIRIRPDALMPLIRPFADLSVGIVSGRDVSVGAGDGDANTGEAGYVGYEMRVRELETRAGGIVGASGCFYAIRRNLHQEEVPPELSRDFAAALIARDHGYRAVSAPEAVCYVPRTDALDREYRRKVRTVARGMSTLWAWRRLMNPREHPDFAWKLFSHKVCRWLLPLALVLALVGVLLAGFGAPAGTFGRLVASLAAVLAGAAAVGLLLGGVGWIRAARGRAVPRALAVPAFFLMSNLAVVQAFVQAVTRGSERSWEPTRRDAPVA
jgi:cellulose synthase/poly-beta-1,6-N-acetylglucosamine synthase-like glycosyltransferase